MFEAEVRGPYIYIYIYILLILSFWLLFLENKFFLFFYLVFLSFYIWFIYHHFFFFFLFFPLIFFFGKKILFSIFYTLLIFITLYLSYLYYSFCSYLYSFIICFKIIIKRLRKWCFNIAIGILFHSFVTLKISLWSYMFLLTHMIFTMFYYM